MFRQALDLLLGCVKPNVPLLEKLAPGFMTIPLAAMEFAPAKKQTAGIVSDEMESLVQTHQAFLKDAQSVPCSEFGSFTSRTTTSPTCFGWRFSVWHGLVFRPKNVTI